MTEDKKQNIEDCFEEYVTHGPGFESAAGGAVKARQKVVDRIRESVPAQHQLQALAQLLLNERISRLKDQVFSHYVTALFWSDIGRPGLLPVPSGTYESEAEACANYYKPNGARRREDEEIDKYVYERLFSPEAGDAAVESIRMFYKLIQDGLSVQPQDKQEEASVEDGKTQSERKTSH